MARSVPRALLHLPTVDHEPLQVLGFQLLRQPYGVDTAVLTVGSYTPRMVDELTPGTPIKFRWGYGVDEHVLYGYIYEARPEVVALQRMMEVIIVGAQHPMTWVKRVRSFPKMGLHDVAVDLADDYLLAMVTTKGPAIHVEDQEHFSDWQYLADLGRRHGHILLSIGPAVVFAPIAAYWSMSLKNQMHAATPRIALSKATNLRSFKMSSSPFFTLLDQSSSPFQSETNFVKFTEDKWSGSVALSIMGSLFSTTAHAVMDAPESIYPLDAFTVVNDTSRMSWGVLQVKYVLTMDDYYAEVVFGSNGRLYPSESSLLTDVSTDLQMYRNLRSMKMNLRRVTPVLAGATRGSHWEAPLVEPLDAKETPWQIAL